MFRFDHSFYIFNISVAPLIANAFCSEPYINMRASRVPDPSSSFSKPDVPFCLSDYSYTGTHSCDQWELNNYFNEVNDYIDELNEYLREVNEFASFASRYAEEVFSYANCEAEKVKEQHQ